MDQEQKNKDNRNTTSNSRTGSSSNSIPRLLERYRAEIIPALQEEFKYDNAMEIPKLTKVVLNVGLGEALVNSNAIDSVTRLLATISGQKAVTTKAKKSI